MELTMSKGGIGVNDGANDENGPLLGHPLPSSDTEAAPGGSGPGPQAGEAYPCGAWSSRYSAAMLLESLIRPEATSAGASDAG